MLQKTRPEDQKAIQVRVMYMLLKNNLNRDAEHLLLLNGSSLLDSCLISSIKIISNGTYRSKT